MNENFENDPKPVVNLDRLRDSLTKMEDTSKPTTFVPSKQLPGKSSNTTTNLTHTPLQLIAHAATKLTWKDAEKMGQAIQAKMKDGGSLTAAVQAWAEEWEKFE